MLGKPCILLIFLNSFNKLKKKEHSHNLFKSIGLTVDGTISSDEDCKPLRECKFLDLITREITHIDIVNLHKQRIMSWKYYGYNVNVFHNN